MATPPSVSPAPSSAARPSPGARAPSAKPLLEVQDLRVWFPIRRGLLRSVRGWTRAVDGVSFTIGRGQTLGLVGESGCGKTTVGRAVLRLVEPTGGKVSFDGQDVLAARGAAMKALRRQMQVVFQDPAGSLNPRMRVEMIVGEPLMIHGLVKERDELRARVIDLLKRCGLSGAAVDRYPHEFSGGQRQRIGIARALALSPRLVICDEPTSALDVSIQAQILNLLADLRDDLGLSYLFISHDMAVVNHLCDFIAVMKEGRIVEHGPREQVMGHPAHEYTRTLLAAVPEPDPKKARRSARASATPPV